MKNKILLFLALAAGLMTASCADQLDIPQKSAIETEKYYREAGPAEAEALIAAVYRRVTSMYDNQLGIFLDIITDDFHPGGGSFADNADGYQEVGNLAASASTTCISWMYQRGYQVIYYCNMILEKIPQTDDPTVNRVKAEANFLRSLAMFELVRWYGNPPLVDHVPSADEYYPENTPALQTITWVFDTMMEAAGQLPAISAKGAQKEFGARISKHAALAYAGQVALWYGTRYNDMEWVAKAVEPLRTVVNSDLYDLVEDMSILNRAKGDFCMEYLFEHNNADDDGFPGSTQTNGDNLRQTYKTWSAERILLPSNLVNMGWGWDVPTADLGRFLTQHEGGIETKRFRSSLATYEQVLAMDYTGRIIYNDDGTVQRGPGVFAPMDNNEGYFRMRDIFFQEDLYDIGGFWKYSMANIPYLRFAEVLLMYAEVQFLVDGDADGSGLRALNRVRQRDELDPVGTLTYQAIKDERRAELIYDCERYFDLVRWGDAAEELKDKGKTWYTFYGYKEDGKTWDVRSQPNPDGNGGWTDKYNYLPYPTTQLSVNPNLKQNPGW